MLKIIISIFTFFVISSLIKLILIFVLSINMLKIISNFFFDILFATSKQLINISIAISKKSIF